MRGTTTVAAVATASLGAQHQANETLVMAAATLAIAPMIILFVILARPFERILTVSALQN